MKEVLLEIIKSVLWYVTCFLTVLRKPQVFVSDAPHKSDWRLAKAMLFWGISLLGVVVLDLPLAPADADLWKLLPSQYVLSILFVLLAAGVLRLSWRVVGGHTELLVLLPVYFYQSGVFLVLSGLIIFIADSLDRLKDLKFLLP